MKLKLIAAIAAALVAGVANANGPQISGFNLGGSGALAGSVSTSGAMTVGTGFQHANNTGFAAAQASTGCRCGESAQGTAFSTNTSNTLGWGHGVSQAGGASGAAAGAFQLNGTEWSLGHSYGRGPR